MPASYNLLSKAFFAGNRGYFISLFLTSAIALLMPISRPAYAAGVVGKGTPGSCTEAALDSALTGGGEVTFNCGSSPVTIKTTSEKVIAATTSIDGKNLITLSGDQKHRIFSTTSYIKLTLKNLTIADGFTNNEGGGIYNDYKSTLNIIHCKFNNNESNQSGEHGGGAIFSYPGSKVIVDRSYFKGNKASLGGAIRILNSDLTVTKSTFTGNSAVAPDIGNGGAIYVDGASGDSGKIILRHSTFTNNSATSYGGAFFNSTYNSNQTIVDGSTFSGNRVGAGSNGQGGAIWSTGDSASGGHWQNPGNNTTLIVKNTTVSDNTASEQGGGIWLGRHPQGINIYNSTFSDNTATNSNGGAITLGDNGKLNITNSTISGNKVSGAYALGGGIALASGNATITNSTIANNYAEWQGGGIVNLDDVPVTLKNTIIANNKANNGGNDWNITHNCFKKPMINGGKNLQFPAPQDIDCVSGILTADPKLGSLANNGGSTRTLQLLKGSAAINAGSSVCPATDQRGVKRPQGGECDLGAFEVE